MVLKAASTLKRSIRLGATVLPGHGAFRSLLSSTTRRRGSRHLYDPNAVTSKGPQRKARGCRPSFAVTSRPDQLPHDAAHGTVGPQLTVNSERSP